MHQYSAREAARLLGRNERTIRRWIQQGLLQASHVAVNRFAIEESEIVRLQTDTNRMSRQDLEARITRLEHQIADILVQLAQVQKHSPARTSDSPRRRSPRPSDESLLTEADLPSGSRRASEFAEAHGIKVKTFRYHLLTGLGGETVAHLAIAKPGRPGEIERWLSPEQQRQALDFWQRHAVL